ncbi:MAG: SUMF1/EgtB/PvdO family nonheme iron enzyme [Chloroflexi bacterium]|nr:SUMF1/EgtB/PvdO family nonheme iron enzyme [Chloroflexota bacterium]
MTFTLESWKEAAGRKLREAGEWLQRRRQEDAPYVVYGTVAGLTLWPAVEAAARTGQFGAVMGAIYGTAAGVGANLLASQIEAWKNQARPPTEAAVADWVAGQAAANDELRRALDTILEKLDAIAQAQAGLTAEERTWFGQTLAGELARLGNLARFEASLAGSGAVAQGEGSTAVGERGVSVKGNVAGDIISGDYNRKIEAGQYIEHYHEAGQAAAGEVKALRDAYLGRLLLAANTLSLAGLDPKAASDESQAQLDLAAVYTALLTIRLEEGEGGGELFLAGRAAKGRPSSALAQLNQHQRLVLLGDPGSGKSTFVNFVAMCLAGECLGRDDVNLQVLTAPLPDDEGQDQQERQPWEYGALLPVRIILRDLAARGLPDPDQAATADHLWAFLAAELKTPEFLPYLRQELRQRGGLLLIDGLDEVPEANQRRRQIKQLVEDVTAVLPGVRILVTSRTYAYQKQEWRLPGFTETVLAPFSPGQIRRFIGHWYTHIAAIRHLHPDDAHSRAERLREAIFASDRLQGLAERPLLLTLMASLHAWRGGSLPEKREELYDNTVDLLLDWWESPKVVTDRAGQEVRQPSLAEWLKVDREKVRGLLNRLAYEVHATQPELAGTADIPENDLVDGLLQLSRNPDVKPRRLIEYLSQRAGLLLPRGLGVYTLPHRTFQEYLAACHLANLEHLDLLAQLAREEPNRWREVLLLAAARSERGFTSSIWLFVDSLCSEKREDAGDTPPNLWGAHLAGQALVETANLGQLNQANRRKVARVRDWLVPMLRSSQLPAVERALAAANLARLGDPRLEVMSVDGMQFCLVPKGSFWMGSDEDNPIEKDAERPLHQLDVPYDYWLGRYPVTNAQFREFVDGGGYREERHWPEAQAAGWWRDGQAGGYTWIPEKRNAEERWRDRPYDYGRPFNLPNHPVVGLNWYEALAFSRWLAERWRAADLLPAGWGVQLPSEAEWEKAARGGLALPAGPVVALIGAQDSTNSMPAQQTNPLPQRRFPWGDDPAGPERANYEETGIGGASGVGCFPAGCSPYGCEEMAGTVFEWTRSLWGRYDSEKSKGGQIVFDPLYRYPYQPDDGRENLAADDWWPRVLRGGSWGGDDTWLRCAYRLWYSPYDGDHHFGFRVVSSPISTSGR